MTDDTVVLKMWKEESIRLEKRREEERKCYKEERSRHEERREEERR
jgi:hypothetical protein